MKIIFLDMDGVLNSHAFFKERLERGQKHPIDRPFHPSDPKAWLGMIDRRAVARLNTIVNVTGARVVISSSWRHAHPYERMHRILKLAGFAGDVIGETPTLPGPRAKEIRAWLDEHPNVKDFVILDDNSDAGERGLGSRFLKTELAEGIQDHHVEIAIRLLNRRAA